MRYGIFGDIHGNLEALTAVFAELERHRIDSYLCLGDVIGYGANPRECLAAVRAKKCLIIAGNWEYAVCGKLDIDLFTPYARQAALWTCDRLSDEEKDFAAGLELVQTIEEITLVHSNLVSPDSFEYIQTCYDAANSIAMMTSNICFSGHSHTPVTFFEGETVSWTADEKIPIERTGKSLCNVGSVGQPRDEDARACCVVYDTGESMVHVIRVEYDVNHAAQKIVRAGLPEILAERLVYGR